MKGAALHVLLHLHSQACNLYLKIIWCRDFLPVPSLHSGQNVQTNCKNRQKSPIKNLQEGPKNEQTRLTGGEHFVYEVSSTLHCCSELMWAATRGEGDHDVLLPLLGICICILVFVFVFHFVLFYHKICRSMKWELMIEQKGSLTFPSSCFYSYHFLSPP